MAKKPADRFASMGEMADALGRYLKGDSSPVKARPPVGRGLETAPNRGPGRPLG